MKSIFNFQFSIFKKNKGFTLIELIIFMGIFSILLLVLFQLFISIFDVQIESQSVNSVFQDGRYIINKLTYDIKNATSVTTPVAGSSGQTLVISDGVTTYTYASSGGNLNLTNSTLGTTDQLNSTNTTISSINFLRLSDNRGENTNTVTVNITLNSKVVRRGGVNSQNFMFTAGTR